MEQLSRRSFLKTAAIGGTGAAMFGLAACSPSGSSKGSKSEGTIVSSAADVSWDEEFDVVIVGAGIAGLAAAATAVTEGNGLKTLLVEKESQSQGCSPYCHGDALYTEDVEGTFQYLREMCGADSFQVTPDEPLKAFAEGIAENLTWIKSLGATDDELTTQTVDDIQTGGDAKDATSGLLFFAPEWPEYTHSRSVSGWWFNPDYEQGHKHVWKFLDEYVTDHADTVEYRKKAPMEGLVQDAETKTIVGVVIDGKNVKANKGVVMCCGGFEHDPWMMQQYLGQGQAVPAAGTSNTGDGHRACMKIGADFWHMESYAGAWMGGRDIADTKWSNTQPDTRLYKGHGITVGMHGRRFYMDYDGHKVFDEVSQQTNDPSLLPFHVGFRHGASQFGGEWHPLPLPSKGFYIFDQNGFEAGALAPETGEDPVGDGWVYTADSIESLASQIGLPKDELSKTVSYWNEICERGEDPAFYRPASTLVPIDTPPYYAQLCRPGYLNTDGGPVRDEHARILDPDGKPIPHLYSAGEFGSMFGRHYQGNGNVSECLVFGRIAIREIVAGE